MIELPLEGGRLVPNRVPDLFDAVAMEPAACCVSVEGSPDLGCLAGALYAARFGMDALAAFAEEGGPAGVAAALGLSPAYLVAVAYGWDLGSDERGYSHVLGEARSSHADDSDEVAGLVDGHASYRAASRRFDLSF